MIIFIKKIIKILLNSFLLSKTIIMFLQAKKFFYQKDLYQIFLIIFFSLNKFFFSN